MGTVIKLSLLMPAILCGALSLYFAMRQVIGIQGILTFSQKIKKSLIAGCMTNVCIVLFFTIIFLINWDVSAKLDFDIVPLFQMLICLSIPAQISGTTGTFIQLSYLNSLLKEAH